MSVLLISTMVISFISALAPLLIKQIILLINQPTEKERNLHSEIVKLKSEMAKIPLVDNFAAHARVQRKINTVEVNLKAETNDRVTANLKNKLIITYGTQVLIYFIMLYTIVTYRNNPVLVLKKFDFFPFNNIISYPINKTGAISVHIWLMVCNFVSRLCLKNIV